MGGMGIIGVARRYQSQVIFALRMTVGGTMLLTGLSKLQHPYEFLSALYGYELFGPEGAILLALCVPWLEIVVGVSLLSGLLHGGAFLVATLLGAAFVFSQAHVLYNGIETACGCLLGAKESPVGPLTIAESTLFLSASLLGSIASITDTPPGLPFAVAASESGIQSAPRS